MSKLSYQLHRGDCLEFVKTIPDNSIDSIVTDPPYHLTTGKKGGTGSASINLNSPAGRSLISTGFMGMSWDGGDIAFSVELWSECLRVLKPGGHLLAFSGSRTYHRMACAIEDSGFEIRDNIARFYTGDEDISDFLDSLTHVQREKFLDAFGRPAIVEWVYGSGFPKSLDVSKAIDKSAGADREVLGVIDSRVKFDGRDRASSAMNNKWRAAEGRSDIRDFSKKELSTPSTNEAKQWEGWGTALKPAHEPICLARKPISENTVAANVLEHGVGAVNIDGCRVEPTGERLGGGDESGKVSKPEGWARPWMDDAEHVATHSAKVTANVEKATKLGRWPANLIHDGSDEVVALFPEANSARASGNPNNPKHGRKCDPTSYNWNPERVSHDFRDTGSAARFFYCAKASRSDRNEGLDGPGPQFKHGATLRQVENTETKGNNHPTVKPTALMRHLVRLITPPGGVVLDPFMGSGSTGKAAILEGFRFIGVDKDDDGEGNPLGYIDIAEARIKHAVNQKMEETAQKSLDL